MTNNLFLKILESIKNYARTIAIAFIAATFFTAILTIHARNEMLKNFYANETERKKMDEVIARQLVAQSDMIQTLANKKYAVCLNVGNLYETVQDYHNAEYAYRLAVSKAKRGMYTPYYKLATVLISQGKYDEAEELIASVADEKNKDLINFKTKAYKDIPCSSCLFYQRIKPTVFVAVSTFSTLYFLLPSPILTPLVPALIRWQ